MGTWRGAIGMVGMGSALATVLAGVDAASVSAASANGASVSGGPASTAPTTSDNDADWDFNGDGMGDLVVPARLAEVDGLNHAGALGVFYGGENGPDPQDGERLDRLRDDVPGEPIHGETFGTLHAAGDLDGDGYDDLAVCTRAAEGLQLVVAFGGPDGLDEKVGVDLPGGCWEVETFPVDDGSHADLLLRIEGGLYRAPGGGDVRSPDGWEFEEIELGHDGHVQSFTLGDITGDGDTDIAYAAHASGDAPHGQIRFLHGASDGFTPVDGHLVYEPGGNSALALGDITGNGFDDLAVGRISPRDHLDRAGRIETWVNRNGSIEPDVRPLQTISQDTPGVPGSSEATDLFGSSVTLADVDGDGHADLATGVPGENIGDAQSAGRVVQIPGGDLGLDPSRANEITHDTPGVPGDVQARSAFGRYVDYRDLGGERDRKSVV